MSFPRSAPSESENARRDMKENLERLPYAFCIGSGGWGGAVPSNQLPSRAASAPLAKARRRPVKASLSRTRVRTGG